MVSRTIAYEGRYSVENCVNDVKRSGSIGDRKDVCAAKSRNHSGMLAVCNTVNATENVTEIILHHTVLHRVSSTCLTSSTVQRFHIREQPFPFLLLFFEYRALHAIVLPCDKTK